MRCSPALRAMVAVLLVAQAGLPGRVAAQSPKESAQSPTDSAQSPKDSPQSTPPPAQDKLQSHAVHGQLPMDQRLLLVLDRFTYGPRPGDLPRMRAMGMNAWFQQQLNPGRIDDSAFEARLADYPALQLPLDKLMELYPSNQLIRQAMSNRAGVPHGAAEHAIYADQEQRYKERKAGKNGAPATPEASAASLPLTAEQLLAMEPEKRFKELCKLRLPQLQALRLSMTPQQRPQLVAGFTPQQREALAAFSGPSGVVRAEVVQVKLLRDLVSERQLQEVMVDFWLNHFNVYLNKSEDAPYYIATYERERIRPLALGHFEDLLIATATSPAMLNYLDNASSVGPHSAYATGNYGVRVRGFVSPRRDVGLNENYAREVMELHTVGVNGGYTQHDVTELARVFTGWTVGRRYGEEVPAQAQFDPTRHEPGTKLLMGHTIRPNGQREGLEALRLLASSPQCARFISSELAVRFVSDTPPPALVERMAQTFLETRGDIRQVLLTMVNSPEFFTPATYRAKIKTPQDFVLSAVRASGAQVESTVGVQSAIAQLGMPVFGHQTPDGYSMQSQAWSSTTQLVQRMNFAVALATNRVEGLRADPDALLARYEPGPAAALSPAEKADRLEKMLMHDPLSAKTQGLILAQVQTDPAQQTRELRQIAAVHGAGNPLAAGLAGAPVAAAVDPARADPQAALAMGLILGSPEFQRR